MLAGLPLFITIVFTLTTFATLFLFYNVVKNADSSSTQKLANPILLGMSIWLAIQAYLTFKGVYRIDINAMPPKILLFGVLPNVIIIVFLLMTTKGRAFLDSLPLKQFTFLSIVRIPVELVLLWLFMNKAVPQIMTFEGLNFDILAGITAPIVAYLGFVKGKLSSKMILAWNFICLALLMNIVVIALLASPVPFQQLAFDQPNIAIIYFPFSWLPTFVVPIVLLGHLTAIRRLMK